MKNVKVTLLTIVFICILFIPSMASGHERIVTGDILDAHYADLDGDGFEDDIWILINLDFTDFGESDFENGIDYGYKVGLELPSGVSFSYIYYAISYTTTVSILVVLIDHATEPGWYISSLTGFYRDLDRNQDLSTDFLIFDPPGGTSGGDLK